MLIWKGRDGRKRKKELPLLEAGSMPPDDCDVMENVEVANVIREDACKISGAGDTNESLGVDDDGMADNCDVTIPFSTTADDGSCEGNTGSFSVIEDGSFESDPFRSDASFEDGGLNVKNTDEEVNLNERGTATCEAGR